jgi:hypothetical protein
MNQQVISRPIEERDRGRERGREKERREDERKMRQIREIKRKDALKILV